jgi:hypothetical protein
MPSKPADTAVEIVRSMLLLDANADDGTHSARAGASPAARLAKCTAATISTADAIRSGMPARRSGRQDRP